MDADADDVAVDEEEISSASTSPSSLQKPIHPPGKKPPCCCCFWNRDQSGGADSISSFAWPSKLDTLGAALGGRTMGSGALLMPAATTLRGARSIGFAVGGAELGRAGRGGGGAGGAGGGAETSPAIPPAAVVRSSSIDGEGAPAAEALRGRDGFFIFLYCFVHRSRKKKIKEKNKSSQLSFFIYFFQQEEGARVSAAPARRRGAREGALAAEGKKEGKRQMAWRRRRRHDEAAVADVDDVARRTQTQTASALAALTASAPTPTTTTRCAVPRNVVGFWLLGLSNNSPYTIALAAANELAEGAVGSVFFAAIFPSLLLKCVFSPYFFCSRRFHFFFSFLLSHPPYRITHPKGSRRRSGSTGLP